ncbi:MAG: type II secretion system protein [Anaerorhabdus sp.]|uniref:type II secretion system protein n=1 Tax=Anaerorhabdus sp. TaxID=1872524 RepID=UPI002FCB593B
MKKGFTLVEIVVVIAILAVMVLLVSPEVMKLITSSEGQVCSDYRKALTSEYFALRPYTSGNVATTVLNNAEGSICPDGATVYFDTSLQVFVCEKHGSN